MRCAPRRSRWTRLLAALFSPVLLAAPAAGQGLTSPRAGDRPLTPREKAVHVLSRLGFGGRPGDLDRVAREGWKAWVERQLKPEAIPDPRVEARLREYTSLSKSPRQLVGAYAQAPRDKSQKEQRRVQRLRQVPRTELAAAVLLRAVYSERQLFEVLCDFWRNHLNVDTRKNAVGILAPSYERDVIRKYAFGRFEDLLLASAKHPCMLIYLDNVLSQKPLTAQEQKALRKAGNKKSQRLKKLERERGLNENYARELMELHTLGVDNGYTQRDVIDLARVLTGWTVDGGPEGSWGFRFAERVHDPGPKRVLGWRVKPGGVEEGEAVIRGLARHKRTARFISMKLVRYLVADDPPEDYVARVAKVFRKSGGDLSAVYRAIVFDEAFFERRFFQAKFKTPFEFTASALRAVDADVRRPEVVLRVLRRMQQPIYACEDPTGYYDVAEAWLDPGVLAVRWQIALDLAERPTGQVVIPARFFGRAPASVSLRHWLSAQLVPAGLDARTAALLDETARKTRLARGAFQRRLTGLLLGSPAFQRQ